MKGDPSEREQILSGLMDVSFRISIHNQMLDNFKGQRTKKASNPLFQHDNEHHQGVPQKFETIIISSHRDLLSLTKDEAIRIEKIDPNYNMNGKNE